MDDKRSSAVWIVAALVLVFVLLPVLYVLSVGPYVAVYANEPQPAWAPAFYAPLEWAANHSEMFNEWVMWYISFWAPPDRQL